MTPEPVSIPALGPASTDQLLHHLGRSVEGITAWMSQFPSFEPHPSASVTKDDFERAHTELMSRLQDNYPFFHPRYVGQMLKPPHPAALVGYVTAMLINPNNHALDGGPATAQLEKEVVAKLAAMFGYEQHLGHLTSSGTIANLEALFIAREVHPGLGIAHSAEAHYTHGRMSHILGMQSLRRDDRLAGSHGSRSARRTSGSRDCWHCGHDSRHDRTRCDRPDRPSVADLRPLWRTHPRRRGLRWVLHAHRRRLA